MPVFDRELAGDQCGTDIKTVVEDLQEIALLLLGERGHAEIIEEQQIGFGQLA